MHACAACAANDRDADSVLVVVPVGVMTPTMPAKDNKYTLSKKKNMMPANVFNNPPIINVRRRPKASAVVVRANVMTRSPTRVLVHRAPIWNCESPLSVSNFQMATASEP